jgi:methylmalonyl-CoA mutase
VADAPIPLAEVFPRASRREWLSLVERTLKGKPQSSLESVTADGIAIQPLYGPDDGQTPLPFDRAPRVGERRWDIRAPVRHPQVERANAEIKEALAGGAASVVVTIDPAGRGGVAAGGADDLARLLEDAPADVAPVALDAGFLGPQAAQWLSQAAKASPAAPLGFHLDPLGALAVAGVSPGPVGAHIEEAARTGARLAVVHPASSLFLASGAVLHEAGASEASEIAFAAACALAYARALEAAGLPIAQTFPRIVIGLTADAQLLTGIAKLRAARMVWRRITTVCAAPCPARIEARSSRRMLTRAEPWTNLVRLTVAGFAAAVGGADIIVLGTFSDALGLPAAQARRLARNTGLILMEEAHVGEVADPAGGGFAFEALSAELARAAWTRLQAIEAAGGAAAALMSGLIADWAKQGRQTIEENVRSGEAKIVGVTVFRPEETAAVELEEAKAAPAAAPDVRLPGPDSHCPPLAPIRLEDLAP